MQLHSLGHDECDREFWALRYQGNSLPNFPWGSAPFDITVIIHDPLEQHWRASLPRELVVKNVDWIACVGAEAEQLHDAIDRAAVLIGRQKAVGDGNPMTSWHESAADVFAYVEKTRLNLGSQDLVLAVFVGSPETFAAFLAELRTVLVA